MALKWRRIDNLKTPASQPDLWGGEGIQRPEPTTQRDSLAQARQEMKDTGSADLFDAEAATKTPDSKPMPAQRCRCPAAAGSHRAHPESPYQPGRTYVETKPIIDPRCKTPGVQHNHHDKCLLPIGKWIDQAGTEHIRSGGSWLYHKAPCGTIGLQSSLPVNRICDKCSA